MAGCALIILLVAALFFAWLFCWGKCHHKSGTPPPPNVDFGYDQDAKQWKFSWPTPTIGCGTGYICSYVYTLKDPHGGLTGNSNGPAMQQNFLPLPTPVIPGTYTLYLQARNQIGISGITTKTGVVTGPPDVILQYQPTPGGEFSVTASYTGSEVSNLKLTATTQALGQNGELGATIPLPLTNGSATAIAPYVCQANSGGGTTCKWGYGYGQQVIQTNGTVDATKVLREWNTITFSVSYFSYGETKTVTTTGQIPGVAVPAFSPNDISFGYQ
uniref:Membrane protein n=1 Tax=Marseillevirus sp. TaxID=2809551 RepID=A0AA96ELU5_9VIRU|nr:membrane protein [Marseillevirus sp.]